eukprot:IDg15970t1
MCGALHASCSVALSCMEVKTTLCLVVCFDLHCHIRVCDARIRARYATANRGSISIALSQSHYSAEDLADNIVNRITSTPSSLLMISVGEHARVHKASRVELVGIAQLQESGFYPISSVQSSYQLDGTGPYCVTRVPRLSHRCLARGGNICSFDEIRSFGIDAHGCEKLLQSHYSVVLFAHSCCKRVNPEAYVSAPSASAC